jgi:DNA repair protein RadC
LKRCAIVAPKLGNYSVAGEDTTLPAVLTPRHTAQGGVPVSIANWIEGEGPRDKLLDKGAQALSDAELLAVLLGSGYRQCSAVQLARDLLQQFDGLNGVFSADRTRLTACQGIGEARYATISAALELVRRQSLQELSAVDTLTSPQHTRQFLRHHLGTRLREVFTCLFLDSQHRVIRCEDLFLGTLDGAAVYPREVAVRALQYGAAALIFAHNHPSGVAEPSSADRRITERLVAALALLDMRVLDHFIIGRGCEYSFAEHGLL